MRESWTTRSRRIAKTRSCRAIVAIVIALSIVATFEVSPSLATAAPTSCVRRTGTWGTVPWERDTSCVLRLQAGTGVNTVAVESNGVTYRSPWQALLGNVTEISVDGIVTLPSISNGLFDRFPWLQKFLHPENLRTGNVTTMIGMFKDAGSYSFIENPRLVWNLDVSQWDTSKVTNMAEMFRNAMISVLKTTHPTATNWTTASVTTMNAMFNGAKNLSNVDVSNWDTGNVIDMESMFQGAAKVDNLDVSKWNTSNVRDMNRMFMNAASLSSLGAGKWNTGHVTNMNSMFFGASSLKTLDVSGWDTTSVGTEFTKTYSDRGTVTRTGSMFAMFYNTVSLTKLDLGSTTTSTKVWNTSKVPDMAFMFALAPGSNPTLPTITFSPNWSTANVGAVYSTDLGPNSASGIVSQVQGSLNSMFQNASALTSLKISDWDTSKLSCKEGLSSINCSTSGMYNMFWNVKSLSELDLSGWTSTPDTNVDYMFSFTNSLRKITFGSTFQAKPLLPNATNTPTHTRWQAVDSTQGGTETLPLGVVLDVSISSGDTVNSVYAADVTPTMAATGKESYVLIASPIVSFAMGDATPIVPITATAATTGPKAKHYVVTLPTIPSVNNDAANVSKNKKLAVWQLTDVNGTVVTYLPGDTIPVTKSIILTPLWVNRLFTYDKNATDATGTDPMSSLTYYDPSTTAPKATPSYTVSTDSSGLHLHVSQPIPEIPYTPSRVLYKRLEYPKRW